MATQKIICDTDVIIDYWNSKSQRYFDTKNILDNIVEIENIIISAVTKMELIIGANNKSELSRISKNIQQFEVSLIDDTITLSHYHTIILLAIKLLQNYRLSHGLALPDAFIAATSIITGFSLFTYNLKDYKFIENINIYDPNRLASPL